MLRLARLLPGQPETGRDGVRQADPIVRAPASARQTRRRTYSRPLSASAHCDRASPYATRRSRFTILAVPSNPVRTGQLPLAADETSRHGGQLTRSFD